jgi:bifunctional pyridoxal-dependent enzyme with beta-cystathionase and maltose regulon repressor activities
MYTSRDIAEAIEKIPADDLDATAIAWCDLHDRITRETGLSEEAVRQMMKKECLLWIEKMRQFGEGMLSGKVVPLAIHRQD